MDGARPHPEAVPMTFTAKCTVRVATTGISTTRTSRAKVTLLSYFRIRIITNRAEAAVLMTIQFCFSLQIVREAVSIKKARKNLQLAHPVF